MADIEAVRASYDAIADRYAKEVSQELIDKPVDRALYGCFAELVRGAVTDGRLIGDVGCGPGQVSRFLTRLGLPMMGIDASPGMVRVAQRLHAPIPFEVGTFAKLPVADDGLAGAVAPYSMIHMPPGERRAAFAELARTITPGGWLMIAFHVCDDKQAPGTVSHVSSWWDTAVDLDFYFLDPAEVTDWLAAVGFTVRTRAEREPWPIPEHQSRRCYLLAERR
jgi:SAM-dependent methyltransferase